MVELQETVPAYRSSGDLFKLVAGKYPSPAWLVMPEVREATGYDAGRSADAIAFGLWPSRGLRVVGFEFKSNRNDWLRELKDPAKAESIARFCDEWWLVAEKGVAKIEEIPGAWGWYTPTARGGLKVEKQSAMSEPREITRGLLMSVVRKLTDSYIHKDEVKAEIEARVEQRATEKYDNRTHRLKELERLSEKVAAFKAASGIDIEGGWDCHGVEEVKAVGEIVRQVLDWRLPGLVKDIHEAAEKAKEALAAVTALPYFNAAKKRQ